VTRKATRVQARQKKQPPEAEKKLAPRLMIGTIALFILAEFALIDLEWSHHLFKLWDPRLYLLPLAFALPLVAYRYFSDKLKLYQEDKVNKVLMREISFVFSILLIPVYFLLFYASGCSLWPLCRKIGGILLGGSDQ